MAIEGVRVIQQYNLNPSYNPTYEVSYSIVPERAKVAEVEEDEDPNEEPFPVGSLYVYPTVLEWEFVLGKFFNGLVPEDADEIDFSLFSRTQFFEFHAVAQAMQELITQYGGADNAIYTAQNDISNWCLRRLE